MEITISEDELVGIFLGAQSWEPVELPEFVFGHHRTRDLFSIWKSWRDVDLESEEVVTTLATYFARRLVDHDDWVKASALVQEEGFASACHHWLQGSPEVPDPWSAQDLVLLTWTPRKFSVEPPRGSERLEVDLHVSEVLEHSSSSSTLTRAYVLPRGVAAHHAVETDLHSCDVVELVGSVFSDAAEAETTLTLWDRHGKGPMGSFSHVRDMARAL